ncbi:MAG: alkaline phosphatase family protein [Acidobacteriaceae bacterium]|nr:alkaline phosphatase family protein [Acidobacteriaceae bacterium]
MRGFLSIFVSAVLFMTPGVGLSFAGNGQPRQEATASPTTPIQHVVVIFGENISFDHYFGTYPQAVNPPGQPRFTALPGTPSVNGLSPALLTTNPNLNPANGAGASNPFRLNRNQALTADQNHNYGPEQQSFDKGAMDLFPLFTGAAGGTPVLYPPVVNTKGLVMGYYDGNTVTAMWNYAQHFALSDNSYITGFGPSSPGVLNLISGQTNGITTFLNGPPTTSFTVPDGQGGLTLIGDADPIGDACSASTRFQVTMSGPNVGDLLNAAGLSWGWFEGGFDLTLTNANGSTGCSRSTVSPITGLTETDYVPHHQPFQYYVSTRNPTHARPQNVASIGLSGDGANHQYDIHDWFEAVAAGNLPAVSYVKAASYQDGHPGNSNPLDEQAFVVNVINTLMQSPFWNSTAVIIAYDDSDGWYDHQMAPVVNGSFSSQDSLSGSSACGTKGTTPQLPGPNSNGLPVDGRCGYGVRTPLMVISPWAKANFVDHTLTHQSSVLRFIEDNWNLGRIGGGSFDAMAGSLTNMFDFEHTSPPNPSPLLLSPTTGLPQ